MEFHTTRWTLVLGAADSQLPGADSALAELVGAYWRPLYQHARFRGLPHHDAQDAVQTFIAGLITQKVIRRADRTRGRFRTFLLSAFGNFLLNEHRKTKTLKRGGANVILAFDDTVLAEVDARLQTGGDAVATFDREWAQALLAQVERRLAAERKDPQSQREFELMRQFLGQEGADANRQTVADALGVSRETLKVKVHRLRTEFRRLLREEVAATVEDPHEVEEELQHLRKALAS